MFSSQSRYANQPVAVHTDAQGRARPYVTLREVPPARRSRREDPGHVVTELDRLDRIAWQHFGDPEQYWRLCDANGAVHPAELEGVPGRRLIIPLPGGPEAV